MNTCENCEHREQVIEDGEYRCENRDSDLWGMEVGPEDACLDWEPRRGGGYENTN